jgi:hypothetical protein
MEREEGWARGGVERECVDTGADRCLERARSASDTPTSRMTD